jgi:hypothetical protein
MLRSKFLEEFDIFLDFHMIRIGIYYQSASPKGSIFINFHGAPLWSRWKRYQRFWKYALTSSTGRSGQEGGQKYSGGTSLVRA